MPLLAERITGAANRVDVVMLCETADGTARPRTDSSAPPAIWTRLDAARARRSGNGTALLYRRELLGRPVRWLPDVPGNFGTGSPSRSFEVGLPAPLSFVPVHFHPVLGRAGLIEANIAATGAYAYGPYAVLGGISTTRRPHRAARRRTSPR